MPAPRRPAFARKPDCLLFSARLGSNCIVQHGSEHEPHRFEVQVYYEDTDLTGAVYHSNYLAFFERAREHALGIERLVRLLRQDGIGFVVHHVDVTYRAPSVHGETLEVWSTGRCQSDYRVVFDQRIRKKGDRMERVIGKVTLVCVKDNQLVPVPVPIREEMAARWGL